MAQQSPQAEWYLDMNLYKLPSLNVGHSLTWLEITGRERIPDVSLVTDTDGDVGPDPTVGIDAAQTGTGVPAMPVDTGQLRGAMVVDLALWPAVWRASYHVRQAGALAATTNIPWWQTVGSTGVGFTGVGLNGF